MRNAERIIFVYEAEGDPTRSCADATAAARSNRGCHPNQHLLCRQRVIANLDGCAMSLSRTFST